MQSRIKNGYNNGNTIHWGIADHSTNKIAGKCGYYRGFQKGEGELGCILLPQYQQKTFVTSAMLLAIDFGLRNMLLKRIWPKTN